jgi:hypothetical protein
MIRISYHGHYVCMRVCVCARMCVPWVHIFSPRGLRDIQVHWLKLNQAPARVFILPVMLFGCSFHCLFAKNIRFNFLRKLEKSYTHIHTYTIHTCTHTGRQDRLCIWSCLGPQQYWTHERIGKHKMVGWWHKCHGWRMVAAWAPSALEILLKFSPLLREKNGCTCVKNGCTCTWYVYVCIYVGQWHKNI